MNTSIDKKENRGYVVWSIAIGALFGFLINVLSNVYSGIFVVQNLFWEQINHFHFYLSAALFVGLVGYLQFFIFDYPNTFEFSKAYWKRYQSYFFYSFLPGKIVRIIVGIYILFIVVGILLLLYYFSGKELGYTLTTAYFLVVIISEYLKEKKRRVLGIK